MRSVDHLQRSDRRPIDDRAAGTATKVATALEQTNCAAIFGPSCTGKTQTAMATVALLDPDGTSSAHTSAAILNTNAAVAASDRSAVWSSWNELLDRFGDAAPKVLVIDEAGSSAPPSQPLGFDQLKARALLTKWREAGTKFIVIGHQMNDLLADWASWLSNGEASAEVYAASGDVRLDRITIEPPLSTSNPVADKNRIGADGRATMHRPVGNAFFARFADADTDAD